MRHKSSIIVTSIAAPKASTATLGRSHGSPGFSSILHRRKYRLELSCTSHQSSPCFLFYFILFLKIDQQKEKQNCIYLLQKKENATSPTSQHFGEDPSPDHSPIIRWYGVLHPHSNRDLPNFKRNHVKFVNPNFPKCGSSVLTPLMLGICGANATRE